MGQLAALWVDLREISLPGLGRSIRLGENVKVPLRFELAGYAGRYAFSENFLYFA